MNGQQMHALQEILARKFPHPGIHVSPSEDGCLGVSLPVQALPILMNVVMSGALAFCTGDGDDIRDMRSAFDNAEATVDNSTRSGPTLVLYFPSVRFVKDQL